MGLVKNHQADFQAFSGGFVAARSQTRPDSRSRERGTVDGAEGLALFCTLQGDVAKEVGH